MNLNIFWVIFALQFLIACIIFAFLKKILNEDLIELAVEKLKNSQLNPGLNEVVIISYKQMKGSTKNRIEREIKSKRDNLLVQFSELKELKGGVVIQMGEHIIDCSLLTRLKNIGKN